MIFLSFLFYLILSKNSEICGNIIADYDVMQILSAPLLSQKLGMVDSVGNLQTTNFEQSIQLGLINEYGKYGLILAFGKSQNYKIDISQFDQNVNWIQVMYDTRLNLLIPPTLELKIRDGQVINLSVIDISVTLEIVPATDSHKKSSLLDNKILEQNYVQNDPIAEENTENENYTKNLNSTTTNKNSTKVGNTGNATNNGLSNNNKAKLHLQSLKLSNSATISKLDQIECRYFFVHISSSMLGSLSCIMSAMKVNISNDEVLTSIPSIFGDSLVHYIFDGLTYEQLFIEYKLTSLACNMTIRPIDDITELKDVTILFDQIYDDTTQMYLPSDLFYADFDGWEKIKFTNKIPTLTFLQDLKIEYADPPENLYAQQFQKNGHNIVYQNPISIDEVFICNQYCPDGIKESHDRLLIYISSEEEVEFWLNSIDMTTTQNIYLFSPIPIGSSRPISLAGVPKIANLYIQGAQYMTEAGTIEYSLFNVDVDEFVSVENLVVDHVTLNANGLSKMKVNALYIQEYGVIKGRINVQNAYVNFDDFTNSFDSITLEKLNLQLNLTSHAELTYDTLADGNSHWQMGNQLLLFFLHQLLLPIVFASIFILMETTQ
ncbi:hypothetical protein TRFO_09447 [Tritrichomonas foetus]|uniref:Uncharacterized protein n=1 Tax=Tritrichomonas foetus TaxID=1144522 RepID=A0A1J4JJM2_9EUKA|nr:hypothetical protein TRFO_09447 [Tritrichomonas foetus]|eukprot:OHS97444.1 hypothetical protein TRFO_09447 [Tritrichomonas foetus]